MKKGFDCDEMLNRNLSAYFTNFFPFYRCFAIVLFIDFDWIIGGD